MTNCETQSKSPFFTETNSFYICEAYENIESVK